MKLHRCDTALWGLIFTDFAIGAALSSREFTLIGLVPFAATFFVPSGNHLRNTLNIATTPPLALLLLRGLAPGVFGPLLALYWGALVAVVLAHLFRAVPSEVMQPNALSD